MSKKILITSALPYANGPLHFGHIAGAYLPADAYARFERLNGNDVLYISGSDEYGVAITLSADLAKRSPREHVDIFHEVNKNFFKTLNISFDHYSRTTCEEHKAPVQTFFLELLKNGHLEEKMTEQLYSASEGRFLADRYVVGTCPSCGFESARGDECQKCGASYEATELKNPRSKLTGSPLELKETKHWFLLLDHFKEKLLAWLENKSWKPNVKKFVLGYIEALRPRAITRDATWGVPIPLEGTAGKVLYVWFDAPIGYISASMEWSKLQSKPDLWKAWWYEPSTKLVNFIGKDNIPFHAAIFPAMCMGQDTPIKLVDELPANEFYMLEGRQFSKSDGWYIDLEDFFSRYTADQIRYAIAANAPETADSEFTWKDFQMRSNAELLGKFGNLVNRVMVFAHAHTGGVVPQSLPDENDVEFLSKCKILVGKIRDAYSNFRLRQAASLIMELASLGNAYFDAKTPWKDAKTQSGRPRMETTVACTLECVKLLSLVASPIIPTSADKVWNMLGFTGSVAKERWDALVQGEFRAGQKLSPPEILFTKIEDAQIEQEILKLKKGKPMITIDDVAKLDLKVGTIVEAEAVEKSKKLLKLKVDLNEGKLRQIVSGIREHYSPESVIGLKVVVIANLKPAKLMGIESEGMILAANDDKNFELVTLKEVVSGGEVR